MSSSINSPKADSLFDGRLHCYQNEDGYRFSIDPVLLSHFMSFPVGTRVLDLGAGCGIVSLVLAYRYPSLQITALELQPALFSLLQKNRESNGLHGRITAIQGDLRAIKKHIPAGSFASVLCNPPYRKLDTARQSKRSEKALARHEITATLSAVVEAAFFALKTGGRLALVYPANRGASLLSELKKRGFEPKRLQVVYSYPGCSGKLVLVEAVKDGGEELEILPPFYVHAEPGGSYTPEMASMYEAELHEGE
jgi:tRNA1(Val) A37 N6-methylase TrmN6